MRLRRNSSEDDFLTKRLEKYKGYLVHQGYPAESVSWEFPRAARIPRVICLNLKLEIPRKLFLSFLQSYNPNLPSIRLADYKTITSS